MEIAISGQKKLKDLDAEFCYRYPYLKMEVKWGDHPAKENSSFHPEVSICEVAGGDCAAVLTITPHHTIQEIEDGFKWLFNLSIQILRQSGDSWIRPPKTGFWSLSYQNEHAGRMNQDMS